MDPSPLGHLTHRPAVSRLAVMGRAIVFYDSECGFCRWSMDKILAWDRRAKLRPVPLQSPEADTLLPPGMDPQAKMASWHLVTEDGHLYSGAGAAAPLFRLLPGGRPLAAIASALPWLTRRAYRRVAGHREGLARLVGAKACSVDPSARRDLESPASVTRSKAWRARVTSRLEARGEAAFGAFVRKRTDDQLDRTVGTDSGLRMIFLGMERNFHPAKSQGVNADIQYELRVRGRPKQWVVRITNGTIRTGPGVTPKPALTLRMALPTFARIIAGELHPAEAFAQSKIEMEGDFELALKMGEIFGQTDPL
jgi:predicted DCC family thiol-disulfide oxidoreductase YuxK/putative sterol carrier protein